MRYYRIFNLLSLDVALGAVISAAFFGRILRVQILPQGYILLGIIVWLIYTADHLLDAWSMREAATSERHRFHQKYFIRILLVFLSGGIIALGMMFLIRVQLITTGIVFGTFVITYLLVNRWLKYFKELTGSLLYTGGVILPAWSLHAQPFTADQIVLIVIFAWIALTNMLIFARFSIGEDMLNQQKSLATILGVKPMNSMISVVCAICFVLIIYQATRNFSSELVIMFMMELILLLIFAVRYFWYYDRYRLYGDAIFLLPAILLT